MDHRKKAILVALGVATDAKHSPVQVQKMLFLMDENVSTEMGGRAFDFRPYNYGPFDKEVYATLENLEQEGLVEISRAGTFKEYKLTPKGAEAARKLWQQLDKGVVSYIQALSEFVRNCTFSELVSSIYKAYPNMRENSVFQG